MCCCSALLAARTFERHLHSRISGLIADRSKPFGYQKVSLGVQDSFDSLGRSGDNRRFGVLAPAARIHPGYQKMGVRYTANEHGISSAGIYDIHGDGVRGLVVRAAITCRLL